MSCKRKSAKDCVGSCYYAHGSCHKRENKKSPSGLVVEPTAGMYVNSLFTHDKNVKNVKHLKNVKSPKRKVSKRKVSKRKVSKRKVSKRKASVRKL
jgi:hypothetical protein